VIKSDRAINESMPTRFADSVAGMIQSPEGKTIAILGIAFKSGTDDVRNTAATVVADHLMKKGFKIRMYDPVVPFAASSRLVEGAEVAPDLDSALESGCAVVICADHGEFENINLGTARKLASAGCVIADGRNILNPKDVRQAGLSYVAIGRI
jgi:UDPglucose 6-dehydrogenase